MQLPFCFFLSLILNAFGNPLSDELIASINNRQTTWTAGRNFFKPSLGVLPNNGKSSKLPLRIHQEAEIPSSFDARTAWPDCADIIGEIRDQGACSCSWAFAAVEAMSDRYCIASNATTKIRLSAEDLNDCCGECGDGCNGGSPDQAWLYWSDRGIVTGGAYGDFTKGCKSYTFPGCDHANDTSETACQVLQTTPDCSNTCDDTNLIYKNDLHKGSAYGLLPSEGQIQLEIMTNGPVEASLTVYRDLYLYKTGVYQHVEGEADGQHAVKILGWGVEEDVPYWLIANSWNENWGDNGFFKMLRGQNECGIEEDVVAGMPSI